MSRRELVCILSEIDRTLATSEETRRMPMEWRARRRLKCTRAMLRRARYDAERMLERNT
jgi:hypothetical protein